jgi:hypothetical protein
MPDRFKITGPRGMRNLTCRGGRGGRSWLGSVDEHLVQVAAQGADNGRELHVAIQAEDFSVILWLDPHGDLVAMTRGADNDEAWERMDAMRSSRR